MTRGRPRSFDTDAALDAALLLFWKQGYEGTSLAALAEAMGINMPSLYAAFGNKESLFKKALARYLQRPAKYVADALQQPTAREVVEQLLHGAIDMAMNPRNADGCLLVQGALVSGPNAESICRELKARRAGAEAAVRQRFESAVHQGDLPHDTDAAALARYIMTIIWGMSVQRAGGAGRAALEEVADIAMRCLPEDRDSTSTADA